ncbi:MAG: 7-carboxy-7-deazaguanine synthase QueE [Armatimonadetes bacterium]|nr:7-carboxy-7-deazaguanine synthase QueE [Armatimonadota bacterium]
MAGSLATSNPDTKLRVAESFLSIQGEGILTGVPSWFLRLSGCNLRCRWCDTPYASWSPEGPTLPLDEILALCDRERGPAQHVVLTGGEPMLFEGVEALTAGFRERGLHITIETAGTVFRAVECDLMSISPKLASSTPDEDSGWAARHEASRLSFDVLRRLIEAYPFQFKFVVGDRAESDFAEIESIMGELPGVPSDRVLIMPEGTDSATLHARARTLVEPCIQRGWRLCPRLHIDLFGNTKGT